MWNCIFYVISHSMERITLDCEKTIYNLFKKKRRKKKLFMATYLEKDKFKNKKLIQMSGYLWGKYDDKS